jgi:NTP pyrophosphatase (non-canonical NTP hydrolase)
VLDPADRLFAAARKAVARYGAESQWRMVQEEAAELIAAVNHALRKRERGQEALAEEVADMVIMISQAHVMLDEGALAAALERKLSRLERRLEGRDA